MFIFVIIVSEVFMKIILVRHGKTQANIDWKYSTDDTVLAKDGLYILDKTKLLLEDYEIDEVYTSALIRSQETAKHLGFTNFTIDKRINEMNFGDFRGQSIDEVRLKQKLFFENERNNYFSPCPLPSAAQDEPASCHM